MSAPWCQVFVQFDDWTAAEHIAVTDLGPMLDDVEAAGAISSWFSSARRRAGACGSSR